MRHGYSLIAGLIGVALATGVAAQQPAANADKYPERPITMVVGYAPGGGTDIMARLLAKQLAEELKTSIVVENRPGAGQNIAASYVSRAKADGYTLLLASAAFSVNISLYPKLDYDPVKDFEPVAAFAQSPNLLVVRKELPVNTLAELIAYAKKNPGKLNFSSAGNGSTQHLSGELLKLKAGVDAMHIPYKGSGPSVSAVLSGEVDYSFMNIPSAEAHLKSGQMKALAITSSERSPAVPDVPTMEQAGVPGMVVSTWYGMLAPAGTPMAIVNKLNASIEKVGQQAAFKKQLASLGAYQMTGTATDFKKYLAEDIRDWSEVIKKAGIKIE